MWTESMGSSVQLDRCKDDRSLELTSRRYCQTLVLFRTLLSKQSQPKHKVTKKLVDFRSDLPQHNLLINGLSGQALDFRQGSSIGDHDFESDNKFVKMAKQLFRALCSRKLARCKSDRFCGLRTQESLRPLPTALRIATKFTKIAALSLSRYLFCQLSVRMESFNHDFTPQIVVGFLFLQETRNVHLQG